MRPRLIQGVPGLDSEASPFERLAQFARMVIAVPKNEVHDNEIKGSGSSKRDPKGNSPPLSGVSKAPVVKGRKAN